MSLFGVALSIALSAQAVSEQTPYRRISLQDYLPPMGDAERATSGSRSDFVEAGGENDLPYTPPQVVMMAREDMRPISVSVAFNWVWLGEGQDRRPVWFARLRAVNRDRSIERFADARLCPGVMQSLARLDGLPPLDLRVPSLPDPTVTTTPDFGGGWMHDNTYQIRLRGLFSGGAYTNRTEVIGGSSAPFALIIAESLERLLPCWTDTPPPRA